ncbi:unnamed protein product [Rotaria sp. Silwood1]|nr:unnamed protein product [Rotaria sp. Silwood1]
MMYHSLIEHILLLRKVINHPEMTQEEPELNYYIKDYCKRMNELVDKKCPKLIIDCDKQDKLKKSKNPFSSNYTNLQFIPSIDLRSAVIRQKDFNRSIPKNNER